MIDLTVDALACARLVRLAQSDLILEHPREALRAWLARSRANQAGELLDCPWCLAIWTGAAVVIARRVAPRAWQPVARVLAVAMIAGAIADRA